MVLTQVAQEVLVPYDHIDNERLRLLAFEIAEADEKKAYRNAHVRVWREHGVLRDAFTKLWETCNVDMHIGYLRRRGMNHVDAEDVVQEAGLYAFENFEKFEPWRAQFRTWFWWLCRWKSKKYWVVKPTLSIDDYISKIESFDELARMDNNLVVFNEMPAENQSAATIIKTVIRMLKDECDEYSMRMARMLEYALELGNEFNGFQSANFVEGSDLSLRQIKYVLENANVQKFARVAAGEVYHEVSILQ